MNDQELFGWIDHSYDLIFSSLPAKIKNSISNK